MRNLYAMKGISWVIGENPFPTGLLTISVESKSIYDSSMLFIWVEETLQESLKKKYFEIDLRLIKLFRIIKDTLKKTDDGGCASFTTKENEIYAFKFGEGIDGFVGILMKWPLCQVIPQTAEHLEQNTILFRVSQPFLDSSFCSIHEGSYQLFTKSNLKNYIGANGQIYDFQKMKRHIYYSGISVDIITPTWPILLQVYPIFSISLDQGNWLSKLNKEYDNISIDARRIEMGDQKWYVLEKSIKQDVARTDNISLFPVPSERNVILVKLLLKFVSFDSNTGYHQGMSDIVSLLFYSLRSETMTFWCFVNLIKMTPYAKKYPLDLSINDFVHKLRELTKIFLPSFYQFLSELELGLEFLFTHRWFFVNCRREFSLEDSQCIITSILSCHHDTEFILYICLSICACYQNEILSACRTIDDVVQFFLLLSNAIPLKLILRQARCFCDLRDKLSVKRLRVLFQ